VPPGRTGTVLSKSSLLAPLAARATSSARGTKKLPVLLAMYLRLEIR